MGDTDENIVEKLVDTINDVVETVTTTAADALSDAMEPKATMLKEIKKGLRKRSPRKTTKKTVFVQGRKFVECVRIQMSTRLKVPPERDDRSCRSGSGTLVAVCSIADKLSIATRCFTRRDPRNALGRTKLTSVFGGRAEDICSC